VFRENPEKRDPLHADAPSACFGREPDPSHAVCSKCPILGDCASLLLARHSAGHADPADPWVPEGYVVPLAAHAKPKAPPPPKKPKPAKEPVVNPKRLTPERKAEIEAVLVQHREAYDKRVGAAFVDLIYQAGPLLTEAKEGLDTAEYALLAEQTTGYGQTMTWAIEQAHRVFPEAAFRATLARIGSVDAIYQVLLTENPVEWISTTHYVPLRKTNLSVFDMSTMDIRQSRAYEKSQKLPSTAATITNQATGGATGSAPKIIDGAHFVNVLRSADLLIDGWEKVKHNVPQVVPNADQANEMRTYLAALDVVRADVGAMVQAQEREAAKAPPAP
jgi:hypothetical protein